MLRNTEFDPWHSTLCNKPAKGHAHKDLSIPSVIRVHKQAQERGWKDAVMRLLFCKNLGKTEVRQLKGGEFLSYKEGLNKFSLQISCKVVTLKGRVGTCNVKGQRLLS